MTQLRALKEQVKQWRDEYGLRRFVETGCFQGDGLAVAQELGFEELFSCDIAKEHVDHCLHRFPRAFIVHSESLAFLRRIGAVPAPALYWLDAHFPWLYSPAEAPSFPLPDELRLLADCQGVILCDDMRCLPEVGRPIGPELMQPLALADLEALLPNHEAVRSWLGLEEGVLVFLPHEGGHHE